MNVRRLLRVLVLAVLLIICIQQVWARAFRPRPVKQPFVFDHSKHIKKDWTCLACHPGADTQRVAGAPSTKECADCHASENVDKPLTKKVAEMVERHEEIPWIQIYRLPDYVHFSHRRHVDSGTLDCQVCHGDMKNRATPVDQQSVPVSMQRCIDCHQKRHVSTDCLTCHK